MRDATAEDYAALSAAVKAFKELGMVERYRELYDEGRERVKELKRAAAAAQ